MPRRRVVRPITWGGGLSVALDVTSAALIWTGAAMVLQGLAGCAFALEPPDGRGMTAISLLAGLAGALRGLWKAFTRPQP